MEDPHHSQPKQNNNEILPIDSFEALQQLDVPRDDEDSRYIKAFLPPHLPLPHQIQSSEESLQTEANTHNQDIIHFFRTYGFVVIRDVLTPQECQATVNDIFDILEQGTSRAFDRRDVTTWSNWPADGMAKHGMPARKPLFSPQLLRNRQNPNLFNAFALLFGRDDLMISHDRASLFRPTKRVAFPTGPRDMPHWKTGESLHLDMDPWGYVGSPDKALSNLAKLRYGQTHLNNFIFENNQVNKHISSLNVQAVLNLVDNFEEDGGFQCVPGFCRYFDKWVDDNKTKFSMVSQADERNSLVFANDDPVQRLAIRIPMRAGSLVIWDQRTPHGARPNNSERMRCAMFLRMFPAVPMDPHRAEARAHTLAAEIANSNFSHELTDLGRKLFGLDKLKNSTHQIRKGNARDNRNNNRSSPSSSSPSSSSSSSSSSEGQTKSNKGGRQKGDRKSVV